MKNLNDNTQKFKAFYTESLPAYSLPYLINNDSSGLNDDEIIKVDNFIARLTNYYKVNSINIIIEPIDYSEYFSKSNCIDGYIGNTVIDCKIVIFK